MNNEQPQLKRRLTLISLIFFGLATMSPGTVLTTFGIASQISHGMVPGSYIIALIGLLFTAYSYGRMVKAYPLSGSAYTYTRKSIGPHLGFLIGWGLLTDYLFLPMVNYLIFGIFFSAQFPSIPKYVWTLVIIIVVTVINVIGIASVSIFNTITSLYGIFIGLAFAFLSFRGVMNGMGTGEIFSTLPFFNPDESFSLVLAGTALLCFSFLGFDAISTLSEEAVNPKRDIPRAMLITTVIAGILFVVVSYSMEIVHPDYQSYKDADSASLEIAGMIGGSLFVGFVLGKTAMGTLGSGMAAHAGVSRLLYAMGRDSVLPKKIFGYIHPRFQTPVINILIVSAFSLTSLVLDLSTVASFINFGALLAFTFVNVSVFMHYYVKNHERSLSGTLKYLIVPLIGAGFNLWLLTKLETNSIILGVSWVTIGFIYLLYLTKFFKKRPPEMHFEENETNHNNAG